MSRKTWHYRIWYWDNSLSREVGDQSGECVIGRVAAIYFTSVDCEEFVTVQREQFGWEGGKICSTSMKEGPSSCQGLWNQHTEAKSRPHGQLKLRQPSQPTSMFQNVNGENNQLWLLESGTSALLAKALQSRFMMELRIINKVGARKQPLIRD